MTPRAKPKAPVKGASRCYVLVPATTEGGFEFLWAQTAMERQGWTVVDTGYRIGERSGAWLMVELWAVPPRITGGR